MSKPCYCHNCGVKQMSPANFCSSCGTSLSSLKEVPKNNPVYHNKEATVAGIYDEDDDGDANYLDRLQSYQPKISELSVDLGIPMAGRRKLGESIGQIANSPFGETSFTRPTPPTLSPEEALRQFQQEASNTTKKTEIQ